jgi:CDP-diacylglycerol---serine O-phosphatidyltransferase
MKPIRAVAVLPTLFTLANLLCGFFAIVVVSRIDKPVVSVGVPATENAYETGAAEGAPDSRERVVSEPAPRIESARQLITSSDPTHNLLLCGALILLAMAFDAVDGQVARVTRGVSDFGAQLDSLADLVSFGIAPSILLVKMCPQFTGLHTEAIWSIAALFACCAALRLARFNVEIDSEDDHTSFAGLPTPAASAVIASFAVLSYKLRNDVGYETYDGYDWWMQRILPMFSIVLALLMVSRIRYPHPLTQFVRGQRSFAHVVAILFSVMAVSIIPHYAVPLLCFLFVGGPPLRFAWDLLWHRRRQEEPLF